MADREPISRVGFIGLGTMGAPMAAILCRAGMEVVAWNRTRARASALAAAHGARVAESPAEAARGTQAVVTMVVDAPQVEEVLFGPHGVAEGIAGGGLVVDMSTIAPSASRRLAKRLRQRSGAGFLDAPVTGSRPKAEDGTLTIMVGGEARDFQRAGPLFDAMGELVIHAGPQGHGSMVKLLNNTLAAINAAAVAEGLRVAAAAGLDAEALLRAVSAGSGASAMLELKARPMLERDYEPLFKLEHMLKDIRHCLAEARRLDARFDLAARVEQLYGAAVEAGLGERDFAAVIEMAGKRA